MYNKKIFIDFDGVIFDTEKMIVERKKCSPNVSWEVFFQNLNWFALLQEAKMINNAIDFIIEAQQLRLNYLAILTKVHTLIEMKAKVDVLRNSGVEVPVLFVPPHVKKSQIYLPSDGEILIDDSIKNLVDWKSSGGNSIYFDQYQQSNNQFETVNTLKRVLVGGINDR